MLREMKKLQKKLSKEIARYDWVEGATEYESEGLPTPEPGPYELDGGFDQIFHFDQLKDLANEYNSKFHEQIIKKIDSNDYYKIESGLEAFVNSSMKQNNDVDILKHSILNTYDGILLNSFNYAGEETKQFYGDEYFEKIEESSIDTKLLIKPESIKKYRQFATKYTVRCIAEFLTKTDSVWDIEDYEVYRGIGNYRYYKRKASENFTDMISKFSGIGMEPFDYFERQILNSYSLSERVAERFMVQKSNQRRAKITISFKIVSANMFSSFIVCDKFNPDQYEILCLPFVNEHYIFEEVNDKLSSEFFINDCKAYPGYRLRRAKID